MSPRITRRAFFTAAISALGVTAGSQGANGSDDRSAPTIAARPPRR
jgi:hypothetical protein